MLKLFKKYGTSAVFGMLVGVITAIWVRPTTTAGAVSIIVVVTALMSLLVQVVRGIVSIARRRNPSRN